MSCRDAQTLFSARLDGRLGPDGARALDAHLAACPSCRAELGRWEAASAALRAAGPTAVPPFLAERAARAALAAGRPAPLAWFQPAARKAALVGALAAAGVWLAVATGVGRRAPDGAQDPMEVAVLLWTAEGAR